jgi:hypothetical protein
MVTKGYLQTRSARAARINKAEEIDTILLDHIKENPDYTSVDLQSYLERYLEKQEGKYRFPRSYLINALRRLENKNRVTVKVEFRNSKLVKLYRYNYEGQYGSTTDPQTIEIIKKKLSSKDQWKKFAYAYYLNNTIMIFPEEISNDKIKALSHEKIPVLSNSNSENTFLLKLSKDMVDFYELDPNRYLLEYNKDNSISIKITPQDNRIQEISKRKETVLLVEDDQYWRENLAQMIKENGYTVFTAQNEVEAKRICGTKRIDFVILDWDLFGRKISEDLFLELKRRNSKLSGSLITSQPLTPKKWKELVELGFTNIIKKRDIKDVAAKELAKLEMF